ncbi:uncharacterized protein V6R79_018672 [Siganus canaliculatus]
MLPSLAKEPTGSWDSGTTRKPAANLASESASCFPHLQTRLRRGDCSERAAARTEDDDKLWGRWKKKQLKILTEKPAQNGHECLTLGDVVRASAAKLTAKMRLPRTICETPRASMILVRVRYSLSRDRLRDSDAGLRDPGPPMLLLPPAPPPRGSAFTGIITEGYDYEQRPDRSRTLRTGDAAVRVYMAESCCTECVLLRW